jgi:chromosome segregation ATPase
MPDDDQAGILDALLTPLMLPRRAARDLEAIGTAARSLPSFERTLIERLDDLGADVRDMGAELNGAIERVLEAVERLDGRLAALQVDVPELNRDLAATKSHVAQLKDQVSDAAEHLPNPNSRGPIARARDALAGTPEPSGTA